MNLLIATTVVVGLLFITLILLAITDSTVKKDNIYMAKQALEHYQIEHDSYSLDTARLYIEEERIKNQMDKPNKANK